jgi:hypothetical protein
MQTKASLLTALLLLAPAAHAQGEPVQSTSADLNGDGKPEALSVQWKEGDAAFVLRAGGATVKGSAANTEVRGLTVIDLDSSDKRKEVAVLTGMTEYDKRVDLYAFDGKSLKPLGSVPALTEVRGNGIILSDSWQGFWNRRDKFALDAKKTKVSEVPQELYYVGVEATVKQLLPLTAGRADKALVATLAQNSRIQVLAAVPLKGGKSDYLYLVKSATGLLGWATSRDLVEKTEGLPMAG